MTTNARLCEYIGSTLCLAALAVVLYAVWVALP